MPGPSRKPKYAATHIHTKPLNTAQLAAQLKRREDAQKEFVAKQDAKKKQAGNAIAALAVGKQPKYPHYPDVPSMPIAATAVIVERLEPKKDGLGRDLEPIEYDWFFYRVMPYTSVAEAKRCEPGYTNNRKFRIRLNVK
jgi:hypothetical protein